MGALGGEALLEEVHCSEVSLSLITLLVLIYLIRPVCYFTHSALMAANLLLDQNYTWSVVNLLMNSSSGFCKFQK